MQNDAQKASADDCRESELAEHVRISHSQNDDLKQCSGFQFSKTGIPGRNQLPMVIFGQKRKKKYGTVESPFLISVKAIDLGDAWE